MLFMGIKKIIGSEVAVNREKGGFIHYDATIVEVHFYATTGKEMSNIR